MSAYEGFVIGVFVGVSISIFSFWLTDKINERNY